MTFWKPIVPSKPTSDQAGYNPIKPGQEVLPMTRRTERLNGVLRQEISHMLAEELRDPRLASMVSVTRVSTSPDLRVAKVYVSVLGDQTEKSDTLKALKSASGYVRRNMRQKLTLKTVPLVEFYLDDSIEYGAELLKLINKVAPGLEDDGSR